MALPSFALRFLLIPLLIGIIDWSAWSARTPSTANVSITFEAQFASVEELAISSLYSTHVINDLRTDSLALEDLSHAVKLRFDELGVPSEVPARFYDLSENANALADTLEQFYVKVTGMVEL